MWSAALIAPVMSAFVKRRLRDPKLLSLIALLVALAIAAIFAPHPSVEQIRAGAHSIGPAFPLVFFAVHAIATIAPIPRTLFTFTAGVLFGPLTAIAVTVGASTVSAVLALLLIRSVGRDWHARRMTHPAVRTIDDSLARRGWLAVGSLRLIAPVPFSVVNYCCGVSSIGVGQFALATALGVIPGTMGIVILGGALGGHTNPTLLILSGLWISIGLVGLVVDWLLTRSDGRQSQVLKPNFWK